jgi:type IV pilus assembly protein PilN
MNNMNFLTKEYKEKLEVENYFRGKLLNFIMVAVILGVASFGIKQVGNLTQKKIDIEQTITNANNKRIKRLKAKFSIKTNVEIKIALVEDILENKSLKISGILLSLSENVPSNVWLESLIYENNEVRITGFSFSKDGSIGAEENAYYFERQMLDSGFYEKVSLNYLKSDVKFGEKINEFEYILVLKRH